MPAGLVGAQHDDMTAAQAAVLVELSKKAGPQVCVKINDERPLSRFLPVIALHLTYFFAGNG